MTDIDFVIPILNQTRNIETKKHGPAHAGLWHPNDLDIEVVGRH